MNIDTHFDKTPDGADAYARLASWLHALYSELPPGAMAADLEEDGESRSAGSEQLNINEYHPQFYRQLPDFAMALLSNPDDASNVRAAYGQLLYHLAGCSACRLAYAEYYQALRPIVEAGDAVPAINNGIRPLSALPGDSLVHLCQLLIGQAEALWREGRRTSTDKSGYARSLLQMAIRYSAYISQSLIRQRARQDLVRVANLFEGVQHPDEQAQSPAAHAYEPFVGAGGPRHGARVRRGGEAALRSRGASSDASDAAELHAIYLQSSQLAGSITQHGDLLELHLHDLDASLRGHHLTIAIPLGSLLEPVRWLGGNPRIIRSTVPVDEHGELSTPLGHTDLHLSNQEEHNLLEAMFLRVEVRAAD
jgi:hypothetical protein